jgi:hypothetical protein
MYGSVKIAVDEWASNFFPFVLLILYAAKEIHIIYSLARTNVPVND